MNGVEMLKKSVEGSSITDFKVSGIAVQYATICERELWFYLHGVDINRDNAHISTGTSVDNTYYEGKKNDFVLDSMISPDMLEDGRIVEIKPSSGKTDGPKMQLLYYLWYLDEFYNIQREGVLAYPTERKRENVKLTDKNKNKIEEIINRIYKVYNMKEPPEFVEKPICSSCAYKDFCQVVK